MIILTMRVQTLKLDGVHFLKLKKENFKLKPNSSSVYIAQQIQYLCDYETCSTDCSATLCGIKELILKLLELYWEFQC